MPQRLLFSCACCLQGQIKQLLTGLMLNTPSLVRAQLSEALTLISGHDFPAAWPQLLPELQTRLAGVCKLCQHSTQHVLQAICARTLLQNITNSAAPLFGSKQTVLQWCAALRSQQVLSGV
jgi:hypothetical protein